MSEIVTTARTARELLAKGLGGLQANPNVSPQYLQAAEPIAEAMGALHRIERTAGADVVAAAPQALDAIRKALGILQTHATSDAYMVSVMETVASSLGHAFALTKMQAPAAQAAPAAAATQPVPQTPAAQAWQPPAQQQAPYAPPPQPQQAPYTPPPQPAQPAAASNWQPPAPQAAQPPWQQPAPQPQPAQPPWQQQPAPQPQPAQPPWQQQPAPQPQPAQPPRQQQPGAPFAPPQAAPQPAPQYAPPPQPAPQAAPYAPPPQPAQGWQQPAPQPQPAQPPWQQQQPAPQAQPAPYAAPQADPFAARAAAPAQPVAQPQPPPGVTASPYAVAAQYPLVEAELGTHSPTNFYKGLAGNDVVDHGGIFVATYKIPNVGDTFRVHVSLPGGYEFEAVGVVRWTRESRESMTTDISPPGFGLQFTQITPEARQLVYRYARNREPLFHDDL